MFSNVHQPDTLLPEELDAYLEMGWFRMGQTIFTTSFLYLQQHFYSALWLRVVLPDYASDSAEEKLRKKNSAFRFEIQKAVITPEKEALFATYRQGITFDVSSTLQDLLRTYGDSVYNTWEVTLYDEDKLIACGFFDLGGRAAAGITSFYDHNYKRYSPGRYLIYLKMDYCRSIGLQYFYPGYFAPGADLFRYKLEIGTSALQFQEFTTRQWLPIAGFIEASHDPLRVMNEKLSFMQSVLTNRGIQCKLLHYEFLNVNSLTELMGAMLFDFPVFLYCETGSADEVQPIIIYDVRQQHYQLVRCESIWTSGATNDKGVYSSHLLKTMQYVFTTTSPYEMAVLQELKKK